jgi:hypothetical protein
MTPTAPILSGAALEAAMVADLLERVAAAPNHQTDPWPVFEAFITHWLERAAAEPNIRALLIDGTIARLGAARFFQETGEPREEDPR